MTARKTVNDVRHIPENLILFDGVCNLCSALVQFVIRNDQAAKFRFATIQSEIGKEIFQSHGLDASDLQTFVFIADGRMFVRSDAAIEVVSRFGGGWRTFKIFRFVPRMVRDAIYSIIARNRYRWFGRKEVCMVPTADIRERFLG